MSGSINILMAFSAGLLSFFTPCVLPLIPVYISFISGISLESIRGTDDRTNMKNVMGSMILFIAGFSFIFVLLGASASTMGSFLLSNQPMFRNAGGVIMILFGLYIMDIVKIKALGVEKRFSVKRRPVSVIGAFLVGMTFALGWTPCIGPILGSILTLAAAQETVDSGMLLLGAYSAGLAVPFLVTGFAVNRVLGLLRRAAGYFRLFSYLSGSLLILAGILLLSGRLL